MGLWEVVTGRSRAVQPNLDALFSIPSAAVGLQAAAGFRPTGVGAVCFRAGGGAVRDQLEREIRELLGDDETVPDDVEFTADAFGFSWLVVRRPGHVGADGGEREVDLASLCTELHAVNTTLERHGFATGLLCTLVPFAGPGEQRFGLVYLYKQGTYYPFAPRPGSDHTRDTLLELRVKDLVAGDLRVEPDPQRWMALWDAPGL